MDVLVDPGTTPRISHPILIGTPIGDRRKQCEIETALKNEKTVTVIPNRSGFSEKVDPVCRIRTPLCRLIDVEVN